MPINSGYTFITLINYCIRFYKRIFLRKDFIYTHNLLLKKSALRIRISYTAGQREPSVKILCFPLSAEFWRHSSKRNHIFFSSENWTHNQSRLHYHTCLPVSWLAQVIYFLFTRYLALRAHTNSFEEIVWRMYKLNKFLYIYLCNLKIEDTKMLSSNYIVLVTLVP